MKSKSLYKKSDSKHSSSILSLRKAISISVPLLLSTLAVRRASCNASMNFTSEEISPSIYKNECKTSGDSHETQPSNRSTPVLTGSQTGLGGGATNQPHFNNNQGCWSEETTTAKTNSASDQIHYEGEINFMSGFKPIIKSQKCSLPVLTTVLILFIFGLSFSSCKKMVEVDPPINEIVGKEIYNSNATATSVLTGIYTNMSTGGIFSGQGGISLKTGLSADELINTTDDANILYYLYTNALTNNGADLGFWSDLYAYIFRVNSAIEGLSASSGISTPVKQQLLGEAKFLRAFYYFYLVNLYGDVPLLTTTDPQINGIASRTDKSKVYNQIIKDLAEAQNELSDDYVKADAVTSYNERLRPNKAVATALLSRVYLYTSQWVLAEGEASKLIENTGTYQLETLDNTFLKDSKEAIWQLQPTGVGDNTLDARAFVLLSGSLNSGTGPDGNPNGRPVYLSKEMFNAFEIGDNRKTTWVDSVELNGTTYPFAYKYKAWDIDQNRSEYLIVFRLGEQYLIRAEARAQQGKVSDAASDLNAIRYRAGLGNTLADNQSSMLNSIFQERKVELFIEWGHRWLDLKRTAKVDQVMKEFTPTKGGIWEPYKALYPIPVSDIQHNPSFKGHQNPGYPEN
jgi:hypothetical protein